MSLDASFRKVGTGLAGPFVAVLRLTGLTPNEITLAGTIFCLMAMPFLASGMFLIGSVFLFLGGMCDWLDGQVARSTGTDTTFGAFLDSVLDRVSDIAPLLAIFSFAVTQRKSTLASLCAIAIVVSVLIPYIRAKAESLKLRASNGWFPRAPRFIVLLLGVLGGPIILTWAVGTISLFGVITVAQRMRFVATQLDALPPAQQ